MLVNSINKFGLSGCVSGIWNVGERCDMLKYFRKNF